MGDTQPGAAGPLPGLAAGKDPTENRSLALDMDDSSEVPRVSFIFLSSQRAGIAREEA